MEEESAENNTNEPKSGGYSKLILAVLFICLSFFLLSIFYVAYIVEEIRILPADVEVAGSYGFNLDADMLHFGKTVSGGLGMRGFVVENMKDYPIEVVITREGEIAAWLLVPAPVFVLEPHAKKIVSAKIFVPKGTEHGHYRGNLRIVLKKKLF